jgi:hypothetical protein
MTERKRMATEKKASQAKRKYHCACAPGDLSAVQPVMAPPADETTAKADEQALEGRGRRGAPCGRTAEDEGMST